ncbi:YhgE/Pip family protein [Leucobacter sp. PH1c]|uniref:YhgE/Pip family protein n=1 Tax=Leucobacter sp. PH1c TaxID=1397278 RepID=UPI00046A6DC5|nr:YhgE/Pip domain-containing protein [Leucobacter sp. PH1c]
MKVLQMVRAEFARLWATPMARLAFIALMCVPLLYGGLYLWANQDPYAKLDQIPVALVVEDSGVASGDTVRSIGEEVADNLVEDGSFDWHRVSAAQAERGIAEGAYDFTLTIPGDFTESLQSSQTKDPHQAEVVLTTNDANSYLATTIGEQAVKRVQAQIVQSVGREASRAMLDGLADVRSSLGEARDGAGKLADGAGTARSGAETLAEGLGTAHTGSSALAEGLGTLRDRTGALPDQSAQLADGAARVSQGNAAIAELGREVAGASQGATDRLAGEREAILAELAQAGVDPAVIDAVSARLGEADAVLRDANARVQGASGQLSELAAGSQQLADGARALADAAPQLSAGIRDAASGAGTLNDGIGQLADGAPQLESGIAQLADGSAQLRDALGAGVQKLPESTAELRAKQAANIADPVTVVTDKVTSAGTYGAGLAPFFVSLAAWIGIYALFLILKPVSRRAVTALHAPLRVTLAGWLTPALLGAAQMLALFGIVAGTLGFQVAHPIPAYGMMALASATFAAIILALNVWLGSVGQFMGLVLMVLQLVTAGGTFPWQTLPEPLATLHHFLPMSFAVDGLRQLMYGGDLGHAGLDALRLGLVLVIAVLVAALGVSRTMRSRTLRDLQPSLIG